MSVEQEKIDALHTEIETVDASFWETYKPEYVARGSDCLVFKIPDHANIVVKLSTHHLASALHWYQHNEHKIPEDLLDDPELQEPLQQATAEMDGCARELRSFFGPEKVPQTRYVIAKIPVLPEAMGVLFDSKKPLPPETLAVIQIQKIIPEIIERTSKSLTAFFEDPEDDHNQNYGRVMTQSYFPSHVAMNEEETLRFSDKSPDIKEVVTDDSLTETVCDFLRTAIRYTNETQRSLDTMGPDNAVLIETEDGSDYRLPDALMPANNSEWVDEIKNGIRLFLTDPNAVDFEKLGARVVLFGSYLRFINGLAAHYNLPERIDLFTDTVEAENIPKLHDFFSRSKTAWHTRRNVPNNEI